MASVALLLYCVRDGDTCVERYIVLTFILTVMTFDRGIVDA